MDKRTALALALSALVIIVGQLLMPRVPPPPPPDSTGVVAATPGSAPSVPPAASGVASVAPPPRVGGATIAEADSTNRAPRVDTLRATSPLATHSYLAPHAAPLRVDLTGYRDLRGPAGQSVSISQPSTPLLGLRVVFGARDTVRLSALPIKGSVSGATARFQSASPPISIEYQVADSGYLTYVRGTIGAGAAGIPSALLIDLPETLDSYEADTVDDRRNHSYGYKPERDAVTSVPFTDLDSTVYRTDRVPMRWISVRSKYFVMAIVAGDTTRPFESLRMRGGHIGQKGIATATGTATLPITDGTFAFNLYAGPQSWERLRAVAGDFENVNPYAGWMHNVAQPFVTIVMRLLLWLKATLQINYGWVLIIFGVTLRLLMWPLNQNAMRSSLKMQRLQPEMQVIQKKYANDQEALRTAMMKLYAEHGMSPLSPILGCLPMLLPMPVLFALYFVFQNTIEFRGVSFLWMPDLALKDPLYIAPLFVGISMFYMSWMSLRAAPPNPQAKIMAYTMPIMMTVVFLNFASGLNLYYGVQNLVAIPQQWLLNRERLRSTKTS